MTTPNPDPYIDKYFLRTKRILEAEGLNPLVRAQVFIRQGPGTAHGIDEAIELLDKHTPLVQHGGRIYALPEGAAYSPKETLMVIEGRIQDIVKMETMYLGVISAETTKANDGHGVDLESVTKNMAAVVEAAGGRPVSYFGARHWRYDEDAAIAKAAFAGGASSASTDIAAAQIGQEGMGTIPHALENIYAYKYGKERAVVESTLAFDRVMDPSIPRIALIDYNNKEVDDAVAVARALEGRLYGVRIDTCGENVPQGGIAPPDLPAKYWSGTGVTISGVRAVREGLDAAGFPDVKIILSSGFGDVAKVREFSKAETALGMKLYDSLGVGSVYASRMATMDIVAVGETLDTLIPMSKVGREYRPNERLTLVRGE